MSETAAAGPIGLGVKLPFNTSAEFVARYRDNVTRGGIYLRAKKVLPPGTMVNLDLKLTTGERLLHGSAIVHFVSGQQGTGPSGIGLKFLELDGPSQNFLGEMLSNHPGAFADAPPVPNGVGPVQYAERPVEDAAVTRVMTVPSELLGAAVPLPAPGGYAPAAPPPSVAPAVAPPLQTTSTGSFFAANWAPPPITAPPQPVPVPSVAPVKPDPVHTATTPAGGIPIAARPHAASHRIDPALLDRLEEGATDVRAMLAIGPNATAQEAMKAADAIRATLGLDAPGDELTTRLRRILSARLDAAVREIERPSTAEGSDSRGVTAAKALIAGDVASAYAEGVDSDDPAAKAFALAAAVAAAVDSKSGDWVSRAKQLAEAGAGLPFLGNRWALVAHAAHAAGDQKTAAAALAALAKEDGSHPLAGARSGAGPAGGKRGVGIPVAALLLVLGLAGGYAGGMFLSDGSAQQPAVATKATPAKPAAPKTAAAKPAEKPAEAAKVEQPAAKPAETAEVQPESLTQDAKAPTADAAAAEKAAADKAAEEKLAADKAAAEKLAADKAAADKAAADKAAAEKLAADKAAADKAAAEKLAADKAAEEKAAAEKAATAAKATQTGTVQTASTTSAPQLSDAEKEKLAAAEAVTLRRAENALDNEEDCNPYLEPLAKVVASNASVPNMGKAIILRARCYDATDRTSLARKEYRKYLTWFPRGAYVDEAREANQ